MSEARREWIWGGTALAAALLLALTAGPALAQALRAASGQATLDRLLAASLLLNLALTWLSARRFAAFRRERSQRLTAEAALADHARRDAITGLSNRAAFVEDAAPSLRRTLKRGGGMALLLIDLDHFATVNDVHGHAIGDALLAHLGRLIERAAPAGTSAARLGGDEFALLVPLASHDRDEADALAAGLVSALSEPVELNGVPLVPAASIGIAQTEPGCSTVEQLMRRADIALYAAKQAGRRRATWFAPVMERELQMRGAIETGIRDGIPLGQFVPFYEPQVDLASGRLLGFELLARWEHPTRGLIGPEIFVPVAEESGLIADLSLAVMRQAFDEAKNWDASLSLSVNIAPAQLHDAWFAQKLLKLLVETGFPAERLEIEITERALVENLGVAETVIGSLRNQGVRLALDDFGTGYSSLANLRALPFDRVKIDRSFVTSLCGDTEAGAIVAAITRLSDSLGLPVTAEGVETPEIEARLKEIGCYQGQGWHFGKPMDVGQVRAMLAERDLLPVARLAAAPSERIRGLRRLG